LSNWNQFVLCWSWSKFMRYLWKCSQKWSRNMWWRRSFLRRRMFKLMLNRAKFILYRSWCKFMCSMWKFNSVFNWRMWWWKLCFGGRLLIIMPYRIKLILWCYFEELWYMWKRNQKSLNIHWSLRWWKFTEQRRLFKHLLNWAQLNLHSHYQWT